MKKQRLAHLNRAAWTVFTIVTCTIGVPVSSADAQSDGGTSHRGGEVTIITGPEKNTVQARSTRFQ
jgi:hypothetical protein